MIQITPHMRIFVATEPIDLGAVRLIPKIKSNKFSTI